MAWQPGSIMLNTQSNMLKGIIAISGIVAASVVVVVVVKALAKRKQTQVSMQAGEAEIVATVVKIVLPLVKEYGGMALDKWIR